MNGRRLTYSHRTEIIRTPAWVFHIEAHQCAHVLIYDVFRRDFVLYREGFSSGVTKFIGVVGPEILRLLPPQERARAIAQRIIP